jgi:hypothetical protein
MLTCVAVTDEGSVDPRWRRTHRVAIAGVKAAPSLAGKSSPFRGTPYANPARSVPIMQRWPAFRASTESRPWWHAAWAKTCANMIRSMGITVRLGATGEARQAVATAWQSVQPGRTRPPVPPNHPSVDGLT